MVILFLIFQGSTAAALFFTFGPTVHSVPISPHPHQRIFFLIAVLMGTYKAFKNVIDKLLRAFHADIKDTKLNILPWIYAKHYISFIMYLYCKVPFKYSILVNNTS